MKDYPNIRRALYGEPWAIMPDKLLAISEVVIARISAGKIDNAEDVADMEAKVEARRAQGATAATGTSIAVIPVLGTIVSRPGPFTSGATTAQGLSTAIRSAASDPDIAAIVLDVDSPGGSVFGIEELGVEIREARKRKPIVAVANHLMASAAYWIGSSATEVFVSPSGQVGSIGVIAMHVDQSDFNEKAGFKPTIITSGKYKGEGNPHESLDNEALAFIQAQLDTYYSAFVSAVSKGRGVPGSQVRSGFGEGRVLTAAAALDAGMVDKIGTLNDAIVRASKLSRTTNRGRVNSTALALSIDIMEASTERAAE